MARTRLRPSEPEELVVTVTAAGASPARVLRTRAGLPRLACDAFDLRQALTREEYLALTDPVDRSVSSWKDGAS